MKCRRMVREAVPNVAPVQRRVAWNGLRGGPHSTGTHRMSTPSERFRAFGFIASEKKIERKQRRHHKIQRAKKVSVRMTHWQAWSSRMTLGQLWRTPGGSNGGEQETYVHSVIQTQHSGSDGDHPVRKQDECVVTGTKSPYLRR